MDNTSGLSPMPQEGEILLSFPQAMEAIISNHHVTRIEWNNTDFGFLKDGWLTIHKNGEDFVWKVSDGDMLATDWKIV